MRRSASDPEYGLPGPPGHAFVMYEPYAIKPVMIPCQARALLTCTKTELKAEDEVIAAVTMLMETEDGALIWAPPGAVKTSMLPISCAPFGVAPTAAKAVSMVGEANVTKKLYGLLRRYSDPRSSCTLNCRQQLALKQECSYTTSS